MPRTQPVISFQQVRNYLEKFSWIDPHNGLHQTGFNPPEAAREVRRMPFHIRFLTKGGEREEGNAICMKLHSGHMRRTIQFVTYDRDVIRASMPSADKLPDFIPTGQFREVFDYLIISIDGTRVVTH